MLRIFSQEKKGFTLVELLVVVAIIALLSSITLVTLNPVRAKGRDSKRFANIKEMQTALELYYDDNNGVYPSTAGAWRTDCSNPNDWIPGIVPTYVRKLPYECSGGLLRYQYRSDGTDFKVMAYCENSGNRNTVCNNDGGVLADWYEISTPGGANW